MATMTMTIPRSSTVGTRPAYLDSLYRDSPNTPSTHSPMSSISCSSTASSYDLRAAYHSSRLLTPPVEEDQSDTFSTRSKRSFLGTRKFRLGAALYRRTYPQSEGMTLAPRSPGKAPSLPPSSPPAPLSPPAYRSPPAPLSPPPPPPVSAIPDAQTTSRRPSLPPLHTSFPPPLAIGTYAKKPLPAVPGQKPAQAPPRPDIERLKSSPSAAELSCQRCYYFAARNCQGYVMGGEAGDPCEGCLQAGYFGAK